MKFSCNAVVYFLFIYLFKESDLEYFVKNICEFQYLIIKGYICALQLMWKMEWITLLEVCVRLHNDMICYWAIRFFLITSFSVENTIITKSFSTWKKMTT